MIGTYEYVKWSATLEVAVYLMEVLKQHTEWQESSFRERRWTSFADAATLLVGHPAREFLDRAKVLAADSIPS